MTAEKGKIVTNDDFVNKIVIKQERTRDDIRSLAEAVSLLREEMTENTSLLQRVVSFQAAQDERENRQVEIAKDVARIAHSVTSLVEGMYAQNQELTSLIKELRMNMSVDASMNRMITRIDGLGVVLDDKSSE